MTFIAKDKNYQCRKSARPTKRSLAHQKSVNLQYITLGCLDDGTNKLSTNGLIQIMVKFQFFTLWYFWPFSDTGLKSVNLQYITLGCLDNGTNKLLTKRLMFQVLLFFHDFLQNFLQKSFQFIFYFFYKITKIRIKSL